LERFSELLDPIISYMIDKKFVVKFNARIQDGKNVKLMPKTITVDVLQDVEWQTKLYFLIDILRELNKMNTALQGRDNYIGDMLEILTEYKTSLNLLSQDILNGIVDDFQSLKAFLQKKRKTLTDDEKNLFSRFIEESLLEDLNSSFKDIEKFQPMFDFIHDPFEFEVTNNETISQICSLLQIKNAAEFRRNIVHLQSQKYLKTLIESKYGLLHARRKNLTTIWMEIFSTLEDSKSSIIKLAVCKIFSMFGSTWACESFFSKLTRILNKDRTSLTQEHLEDQMRISANELISLNFIEIMNENYKKNVK
jgi:hypothetical protein